MVSTFFIVGKEKISQAKKWSAGRLKKGLTRDPATKVDGSRFGGGKQAGRGQSGKETAVAGEQQVQGVQQWPGSSGSGQEEAEG